MSDESCPRPSLWQRLRFRPILRASGNWLLFCLSTMVLVFLAEAASRANYGRFPLLPTAAVVVLNSVLLIFLASIVFAATNRLAFSIALIDSAYLIVFVSNVVKVRHLQAIIRPLDFHYFGAFQVYFTAFFGKTTLVLFIASAILWAALMALLWRRGKYRVRLSARVLLAVFSLAGVVGLAYCDKNPTAAHALNRLGMEKKLFFGLDAAQRRGFLFEFLSDIPNVILYPPDNYTETEVARAVGEHCHRPERDAKVLEPRDDINVVVYLVESFMDPLDLHIKFSSDPIPEFRAAARAHTSGSAIVPNEFCGSSNTEFEILTGMSCSFLPHGACPFVQYVKQDIPSLPAFLRERGYTTHAIHVDRPVMYSRLEVYPHLRMDQVNWLSEKPGVLHDVPGRCPADEALVDAIIDISKIRRRYFVFAFTGSTHSPYDYDRYLDSDLEVCDSMDEPARKELKTYINALRTADRAIGRLLNHFRQTSQKTIVVICGDHRPPFAHSAIYAQGGGSTDPEAAALPKRRQVPLLIWSNFAKKGPDVVYSTNFLGADILSRMGVDRRGFLAMNDSLRSRLTVLSDICLQTADGKQTTQESASRPVMHLLEDYRLLQYDALLGNRYGTGVSTF